MVWTVELTAHGEPLYGRSSFSCNTCSSAVSSVQSRDNRTVLFLLGTPWQPQEPALHKDLIQEWKQDQFVELTAESIDWTVKTRTTHADKQAALVSSVSRRRHCQTFHTLHAYICIKTYMGITCDPPHLHTHVRWADTQRCIYSQMYLICINAWSMPAARKLGTTPRLLQTAQPWFQHPV